MGMTKPRLVSPSPLQFFMAAVLLVGLARSTVSTSLDTDLTALLSFRAASDPSRRLASWNRSAPGSPCGGWFGVSCSRGRVTRLVLDGLSLSGPIHTLVALDQLRILSLNSNLLSGPVPDLSPLSALKLLFLSRNALSGPIPPSIAALRRLNRLDLSHNNLSGPVPLAALPHLLTLRLEGNRLSGPISGLFLPNLQDLNLSSNLLSGAVPPSLSSFPVSAFLGNPLCGRPLPDACSVLVSEPSHPGASAAPLSPSPRGVSRVALVAIVVGDFVVLVAVAGLLFCYFWRRLRRPSRLQEGEKMVYSASPYYPFRDGEGEPERMVFVEGVKRFELEDLLRASAEMLGKGGYGTAYKAVLDDGSVVAVKRLRDVQVSGKREFEQQMEALGRLRHQNLVALTAYYYARDEKLLVYDFMQNGSLFSLLHGNRGSGRTALDWASRVRIAAGAARGLAHVHRARMAHGNVKSSNVLLDKDGRARLADVGLARLGPASAGHGGYAAPEAGGCERGSLAADVYALGVVLLELLTGRPAEGCGGGRGEPLPRWVASVVREEWTVEVFDLELMRYKGIEEEMVGLLQVAMACTASRPEQRPEIGKVVKMVEEIRCGGEMSPSDSPTTSEEDSSAAASAAAAGSRYSN